MNNNGTESRERERELSELRKLVEEQKSQLKKLTSGGFMAAKLHNELAEIPADQQDNDEIRDGYQLKFVGKDYAKFQAGLKTETIITPDTAHNSKPENVNSENIFITGDNLDALKHLENAYSGKVDVIYIDPPYNTGSDGFVYADNFKFSDDDFKEKLNLTEEEISRVRALSGKSSHPAWLTFMLPRLMIAKRLLSDTGVIFISIDDNELYQLKMLCDEIFTENNFEGNLIWKTKTAAKGVPTTNMLVNNHDYIIVYSSKNTFSFLGENRDISKFTNPDNDPRGPWKADNMKSTISTNYFEIEMPKTGWKFTKNWAFSKDSMNKMIKENKIIWPSSKTGTPRQKRFLSEMTNSTTPIKTLFGEYQSETATNNLKVLFNDVKLFNFPKPVPLVKYLIKQSSQKNSLILDFFAGSATTADAVMQLNKEDSGNRKYILVQLPEKVSKNSEAEKAGYETIDQISRERIERAATKIGDNSGFKHFRLTTPNDENALLKLEEFDPNAIVAFPEDMTTTFNGGEKAILQTWLIDDGFEFNQTPKIVEFAGYQAHYIEQRLYLISTGWTSEATRELLNAIGKNKLAVQSIVIFPYSFAFNELNELKINLRTAFEKSNKIELLERY